MDKKVYNKILLTHKKEWIWITWTEMDKTRACYTEWRKSDREKQILYINAYTWNLEKWYWWTYLQGRKRDINIENGLVDTVRGGAGGTNWESNMETYTLLCVE